MAGRSKGEARVADEGVAERGSHWNSRDSCLEGSKMCLSGIFEVLGMEQVSRISSFLGKSISLSWRTWRCTMSRQHGAILLGRGHEVDLSTFLGQRNNHQHASCWTVPVRAKRAMVTMMYRYSVDEIATK